MQIPLRRRQAYTRTQMTMNRHSRTFMRLSFFFFFTDDITTPDVSALTMGMRAPAPHSPLVRFSADAIYPLSQTSPFH